MDKDNYEAYYAISKLMAKVDKRPKATGRMFSVLRIVIKSSEFDRIASGEQTEIYRTFSTYWQKRLWRNGVLVPTVHLHRGFDPIHTRESVYRKNTIIYNVETVKIGYGKHLWGAPQDAPVYIIKLGKYLNNFLFTI